MNSIVRKQDQDGLVMLDAATTSLCGTGTTLASGYISAAVSRIISDVDEPGPQPIRCVLHGYQTKDLQDELTAGVGTYNVADGMTARVFAEGFQGMIGGAQVYVDGNIVPDATPDAIGGVFSEKAIIFVKAKEPRTETERKPNIGGGSDIVYIYSDYIFGERSTGNWLYEIKSDATAPTS